MLSEELSPKAQSQLFAEFAGEQIEQVVRSNKTALGYEPPYSVMVDGREGGALQSVRPNGVIIAEWKLVATRALTWIHQQLRLHSPVSKGVDPDPNVEYLDSHRLYADGNEIDVHGVIPAAREFVFVNIVPYAKKLELRSSSQAPNGVYQVVAVLARSKFPGINAQFDYRPGGSFPRMPAIVVTLGDR